MRRTATPGPRTATRTTADGYARGADGYAGAADGYGSDAGGYAGAADTFAGAPDGYAGAPDDFPGSAGYLGPGSYTEPGLSDPRLVAPDAGVDPYRWQADQDPRREAGRRGLAVGAVTGFLAAAVAIGVSTLAAGFVRPQASPMAALGSVFIDRMPAALKNVALQHFGTHGRTVLLLGMYAAIAVLAVGIGLLARRAAASGVAGLAAFSLIAAFVTITRPGGRVSDVAPAIIGGIAGVAALLWLMQASAPPQGAAAATASPRQRPQEGMMTSFDRRKFLTVSGVTAATAVTAGVGGKILTSKRTPANMAAAKPGAPAATSPAPMPTATATSLPPPRTSRRPWPPR